MTTSPRGLSRRLDEMLPPRRAQDDHPHGLFRPTGTQPRLTIDGDHVVALRADDVEHQEPIDVDELVESLDTHSAAAALVVAYADGSRTLHPAGSWPALRLS